MDDTIKISKSVPEQIMPDSVRLALQSQQNPQSVGAREQIKYPCEPIALPSQGYFYDVSNPLSNGVVDIKYMTAKEEDILTSQNLIKKGVVLERLLESLIVTPGVKLKDILIGDKNALFIAARRLAYGDNYGPVEITCKKCGTENKKTIDLSVVHNQDFDFSKFERGTNIFQYSLPVSKKVLSYKLLTHDDEAAIEREIESLSKINKTGASSEITTRLKRMILSVDGNSERAVVNKFVDTEFIAKDSLAFRTYVRDNTPNVDTSYTFICDECSHEEVIDIPIGVSFFWPNARV